MQLHAITQWNLMKQIHQNSMKIYEMYWNSMKFNEILQIQCNSFKFNVYNEIKRDVMRCYSNIFKYNQIYSNIMNSYEM